MMLRAGDEGSLGRWRAGKQVTHSVMAGRHARVPVFGEQRTGRFASVVKPESVYAYDWLNPFRVFF
jgi:hypothetical protein